MVHVIADISGHGFGHAAQAGPVLAALDRRWPGYELTVRAAIPDTILDQAIGRPYRRRPPPPEACMAMAGPTRVDRAATLAAYADLHRDWDRRVDAEAERLAGADLLLADAPYLGIAAATAANIPAVALCSFGWDQVLRPYFPDEPAIERIVDTIRGSYAAAAAFLRCEPALDDPGLGNVRSIGPVGRQGRDRREWLRERAGAPSGTRLVAVSFGGVAGGWNMRDLPPVDGVVWVLGNGRMPARRDVLSAADLGLRFIDLIASADAVFTKSGYGTFVEAAHHGTRVLYIDRPDWAEAAALEPWIEANGTARALFGEGLTAATVAGAVTDLLARPAAPPVALTGIDEAVSVLVAARS